MTSTHPTTAMAALKREFAPPPVSLWQKYKQLRKDDNLSKMEALAELHVGSYLAKLATALAINRLTARFLGSSGWDPTFSGDQASRLSDSSPIAMTASMALASMVPPSSANYLTALEYALTLPRFLLERAAFRRVGIAPDPAGVLLTPSTAYALDIVFKCLELPKNLSRDPATQVVVAINGMIGSVVRMVEAGIILAVAAAYDRYMKNNARVPPS